MGPRPCWVKNLYGLPDCQACPGASGPTDIFQVDLEGEKLTYLSEEAKMRPGTLQMLNDCLLEKWTGWKDGWIGGQEEEQLVGPDYIIMQAPR